MSRERLSRKQQLVKSGDAYFISVAGCNNPKVNEDYYFGPPIRSCGSPDGIQNDSTSFSIPIWGESDRPIDRILGRKVIVGHEVTGSYSGWSPFLLPHPDFCPPEPENVGFTRHYIHLDGACTSSRTATCFNRNCPFNAEYTPPEPTKTQRLIKGVKRIIGIKK